MQPVEVAVVFGVLVDRFSAWVAPWPDGIPIQLLYYAVGITLLTVGIAVFIDTGLPPNPYERFVSDLSRHFGIPFRKVKTVYDYDAWGRVYYVKRYRKDGAQTPAYRCLSTTAYTYNNFDEVTETKVWNRDENPSSPSSSA